MYHVVAEEEPELFALFGQNELSHSIRVQAHGKMPVLHEGGEVVVGLHETDMGFLHDSRLGNIVLS